MDNSIYKQLHGISQWSECYIVSFEFRLYEYTLEKEQIASRLWQGGFIDLTKQVSPYSFTYSLNQLQVITLCILITLCGHSSDLEVIPRKK